MNRLHFAGIIALVFGTAAHVAAQDYVAMRDATPETPGVESWSITSPFQSGTNKVELLLPDNREPSKRYPVIYCLPVNAGTQGQWGHPLLVARENDLANRYQAIFVTPSFPVLPWYGDNPDRPEFRENSHILKAVIPFVESHYPVQASGTGRYLVGFSKSALGALSLFLQQPETFHRVAVFENWWGVPNEEQWNKWGFAECYGTRANFDTYDPQNLLRQRKEELAKGPTRIAVLLGGPGARIGVEALLFQLRDSRIPHIEIRNTTMSHTWTSGWFPLAIAALDPGR